jgi:hypothetical protein
MQPTPSQIKIYEKALNGPAPVFDPNWTMTNKLFQLVVLQANQILDLQAQQEAVDRGNDMAARTLAEAIQQAASSGQASHANLSNQEARQAMDHLDQAIVAYQQGKAVSEYAGQVLRFSAFLL